jgi:septum formation topological specificity factor MinE
MAQQLVYTSAGKLLEAGRSGFGTVARSKSLSPLLVSAIERVSQFANIRGTDRSRVIFVHRRIIAANNRVNLISRIADAGADYTGRTNHIAHHLIISQEEMHNAAARGITPADVLMQFSWFSRWEETPKFFGPEDDVQLEQAVQPLGHLSGRAAWTRLTGNHSHARLLAWDGAPRNGVLLVPRGAEPLGLLAEALAEFGPQSWSRTFTTNLETTDEMADFDWVVSSPETFREIESRCGARTQLDLSQPPSLPVPPEPVQATPQPQAAHHASGMSSAPDQSHDAGKQQSPHVQAVHVRLSDGSSPHHSISKPASSHSRKVRMQMILAGAAMIVLLGVLGVAAWKTIQPKEDKKETAEKQLQDDKKKAQDILDKAGLQKTSIEHFLGAVSEDWEKWAKFTKDFIDATKSEHALKSIVELKTLDEKSLPPSSWLWMLAQAKTNAYDLLKTFEDKTTETTETAENRLELISKFSKNTREAAEKLNIKEFTDARDKLVNGLVIEEIDNDNGKAVVPRNDVVVNLFAKKKDQDIFEHVMKHRAKPESVESLPSDIIEEIQKAPFVSDDTKKLFKQSLAKNQASKTPENASKDTKKAAEKTQTGPDLAGVPEMEIIIVTPDQMKKGVEVKLLKPVFATHFRDKVTSFTLKGLGIIIYPEDTINQKTTALILSDNNEYFCWTLAVNNQAPKFFKDTFSFEKNNLSRIDITFKDGSGEKKSHLVIDVKDPTPLFTTTFQIKQQDENNGVLSGDLCDYVRSTHRAESLDKNLIYKADISGVEITESKGQLLLSVPKTIKTEPEITLNDSDKTKINTALTSLINCKEEKERNELKFTLDRKIRSTIGEKLLILKDPSFSHGKEITTQKMTDFANSHEKLSVSLDSYRYNEKSYNKWLEEENKDSKKSFTEYKAEIDTKNFEEFTYVYSSKDDKADNIWKKYSGSEFGFDDILDKMNKEIENYIKNFFTNTAPPGPDPTFKQKISPLKTVTVYTKNGRVLFRADRKD